VRDFLRLRSIGVNRGLDELFVETDCRLGRSRPAFCRFAMIGLLGVLSALLTAINSPYLTNEALERLEIKVCYMSAEGGI